MKNQSEKSNICKNPYNFSLIELDNLEKSLEKVEFYFTDTRDWLQWAFSPSINSIKKIIKLISNYIKPLNGILEWWYAWATPNEKKKFDFIKQNWIFLSAFWSSKIKWRELKEHFEPILKADSEFVTIYVKCSPSQIENVLNITKEQNLDVIKESVEYLKKNNKKIIVDLEHFFDWYFEDKQYVTKCIKTIIKSWWEKIVLCDTLWWTSPDNITNIIKELCNKKENPEIATIIEWKIWLHLHEDKYDTKESIIKSLATWNISHIQWNFWYTWERVWNTPLALLFVKLFEDYNIDVFSKSAKRDLLWKNLMPTYSQITHLLTWKFPSKIDRIFDILNSYHFAWQHFWAVLKDEEAYSIIDKKLRDLLNISNYPWLTNQSWKANVLYYLKNALKEKNLEEIIKNALFLLKEDKALDYTDSTASFILQAYKILNYKNEKNIQSIINKEFWISRITTLMETNNDWEHLETVIKINLNWKNHVIKEKENWIFNWFFKLLVNKLRANYEYIDKLELISYESKSQNNNSDSNVVTKLVFREKKWDIIFSVISQNKNADIANINAIKEAFYYYILCKRWEINHVKSKIPEIRYEKIKW